MSKIKISLGSTSKIPLLEKPIKGEEESQEAFDKRMEFFGEYGDITLEIKNQPRKWVLEAEQERAAITKENKKETSEEEQDKAVNELIIYNPFFRRVVRETIAGIDNLIIDLGDGEIKINDLRKDKGEDFFLDVLEKCFLLESIAVKALNFQTLSMTSKKKYVS